MNESKKYVVSIGGHQYTLSSNESPSHIVQAALMVDTLLQDITQKAAGIETKKALVLTALRLAQQLVVHQEEAARVQSMLDRSLATLERVA